MTAKEIEANLALLIANFNPQEFIFDLLLAYGISKTSVTRLKKGDANFSKTEGEVLYKNKLFFAYADADLHLKLENFAQDPRILKHTPRFIIVTNNQTLLAKDLKTKANRDFALTDLPQYFDFFLPLTGAEIYKASNDNKADRDAAYKLAQLYDILVQDNPTYQQNSHQLNLFLSRLLFCFFAEDTGIFDKKSVFTENLALHTQANGADVHTFLQTLFKKLNTKDGNFPDYLNQFPYVNGGLFNAEIPSPIFSAKARQLLLSCGDLDWSEINPDIFGAMIQAVADPEERSNLGMHYTSVPNIKKLIQPLFLDALYQEFEKQAHSLAGLAKLIGRLGQIKFLDPACGSGNFLIITYKEIRLLEIEILKKMVELNTQQGLTQTLQFTNIKLSQFYGIEIKDFAHEMAILSLWLAEHQMNKVFDDMLEGYGQSKPILPLKQAGNIVCGNATRLSWETVCPKSLTDEIYVLGNPPYLG
ncbi:MAG: class I SAM-dependent DNA methyltransferase [Cytophagia bacterium]|nr:MAG: class I SAM-dependent DNA methyltransferase [Cytophagia bacterium]